MSRAKAQNASCISALLGFVTDCGQNIDKNNTAAIEPIVARYDREFAKKKAEAISLTYNYNSLRDSKPGLGSTLDATIRELEADVGRIEADISRMENENNVNNAEFHENAAPLARSGGAASTLQDWILYMLYMSFIFAALAVFFYIGYKSSWNKKYLLTSGLSLGLIGIILYSFVLNFA